MSIKVSVAGYGNLGKALVRQINADERFSLQYVFSRRDIDLPCRRPFEQAAELSEQTDVLLSALGSYEDIEQNMRHFAQYDTVDCFDRHDKIAEYRRLLNEVKPDNVSLFAVGWDPGILSVSRGLFGMLGRTATTWGRGQSMGHGNALRSISGVLDAVQFTCPQPECEQRFRDGQNTPRQLTKRICYVAAVESYRQDIERAIRTMPDYFEGYDTEVHFVDKCTVKQLRTDLSHCGTVFGTGDGWKGNTTISMTDNAEFTAKIMLACTLRIPQCKADGYKGAYSLFDLPLRYFVDESML